MQIIFYIGGGLPNIQTPKFEKGFHLFERLLLTGKGSLSYEPLESLVFAFEKNLPVLITEVRFLTKETLDFFTGKGFDIKIIHQENYDNGEIGFKSRVSNFLTAATDSSDIFDFFAESTAPATIIKVPNQSKGLQEIENLLGFPLSSQDQKQIQTKYYSSDDYTWGLELEIGDVPKSFEIPENLGKWEYSETDILNLIGEYRGVAVDPKGENPPVGGEVNLKPTNTIKEQIQKVNHLLNLFREKGHTPTTSFISHTHVHVHVPGLIEDIKALKKLTAYIMRNQQKIIEVAGGYTEYPEIEKGAGAKTYLKYDGGRLIPEWLGNNLQDAADFEEFITLYCRGKEKQGTARPIRFGVNLYNLKHTKTIEMRFFRSSLESAELQACFEFTEKIISAGLNDGPEVEEILSERNWQFPKFVFDLELWNAYKSTKQEAGGSKGKNRQYWEVE